MVKKFIVAVDLGGTNLKCGLFDRNLKVKAKTSFNTKSFRSRESLIQGIAGSVDCFLSSHRVSLNALLGVGIGVPGPVDARSGLVHFLPNIPGWKEVGLKKLLEIKTRVPVFIDNDAKLMTLAEHYSGAAKKYENVLCLTLGTGVGGGLIINNVLYRGGDNAAGEVGHFPLSENGPRCGCGARGCLEAYIGNNKIIQDARKIFGPRITLEEISALAGKNDPRAVEFWAKAGKTLGFALSGIVSLLNLDAIVIGGGISKAGKALFESIRREISCRAMAVQAKRVKVVRAGLGVDAGLIGAAIMVKINS